MQGVPTLDQLPGDDQSTQNIPARGPLPAWPRGVAAFRPSRGLHCRGLHFRGLHLSRWRRRADTDRRGAGAASDPFRYSSPIPWRWRLTPIVLLRACNPRGYRLDRRASLGARKRRIDPRACPAGPAFRDRPRGALCGRPRIYACVPCPRRKPSRTRQSHHRSCTNASAVTLPYCSRVAQGALSQRGDASRAVSLLGRLWIGPLGIVSRAELITSTGSGVRDAALVAALQGAVIGEAPPPDLPQPVTLLLAADTTIANGYCAGNGPVRATAEARH